MDFLIPLIDCITSIVLNILIFSIIIENVEVDQMLQIFDWVRNETIDGIFKEMKTDHISKLIT